MNLLLLLLNQMWWMLQIILKDMELYTSEYVSHTRLQADSVSESCCVLSSLHSYG